MAGKSGVRTDKAPGGEVVGTTIEASGSGLGKIVKTTVFLVAIASL
jgi:hypothetical protein